MLHGRRGTFQTSNARDPTNSDAAFRRIHQLTETLFRIPGLAGKPKILLIYTCRGDIPNPGELTFSNNFNLHLCDKVKLISDNYKRE